VPAADADWFPLDSDVSIQHLRDLAEAIENRINGIPETAAAHLGRLLVMSVTGLKGAVPADLLNPMDGGGAQIGNYTIPIVTITGTTAPLNTWDHSGRIIKLTNAATVAVTAAAATDPQLGWVDGSACVLYRAGAGEIVPTAGTGLTLRNPDTHTKLGPVYSRATLIRIGTDLLFDGRTAA
jgi:hypothetical protein